MAPSASTRDNPVNTTEPPFLAAASAVFNVAGLPTVSKTTSAPRPFVRPRTVAGTSAAASTVSRRAKRPGDGERRRAPVDRDNRVAAGNRRALDDVQPHAAGADDGDARSGGHARRIGHRADARQHGAADRRQRVERNVTRHGDGSGLRNDDEVREARGPEKRRDVCVARVQPGLTCGKPVAERHFLDAVAQHRAAFAARRARTARRRPAEDDVIADGDATDTRTDLAHDAGAFVARARPASSSASRRARDADRCDRHRRRALRRGPRRVPVDREPRSRRRAAVPVPTRWRRVSASVFWSFLPWRLLPRHYDRAQAARSGTSPSRRDEECARFLEL